MKFAIIVEKDNSDYYAASVPELPGCHTKAKTLDELMVRVKEAIEAYLETEGYKPNEGAEFIGLQFVGSLLSESQSSTHKESLEHLV
ncbi:MAG: type II toxin-antitoxin system HicB family antitoxin [Candidatus Bathyarchaeia archaeon]